ncbi:Low calcium response locus protein S [Ahrensia sp. R2A130]|nr:Low calcium response locus protein S [Ahrensia sp. R2A130]
MSKPPLPIAEVCRKHGVSTALFYKYKAKFGGMDVSDARKLKAFEDENARLKKLLAEQMLDNAMLRGINAKNVDARRQKASRGAPVRDARRERAAGVFHFGHR